MTFTVRDTAPTDASTIADFNNRLADETEARTLAPDRIGSGVSALLAVTLLLSACGCMLKKTTSERSLTTKTWA